jgi:cytochrome c553
VPQFHLNASQRAALQNTLAHPQKLSEPLEPKQQVQHTLAALNCYACHARDGIGGPAPGHLDYFTVIGNADMGDEGRFPPNLTKVGGKLRPDWLSEVLVKKGAVRPYMATRMPQFGEANVGHLVAAFEQADASAPSKALPDYSATDAKFGRKLAGSGGLSCISCHTFADYKSLGIPAIDLTQMAKRLKPDWFRRYLLDPQSLRPGTRMPNFWPEGNSVNKEVLGGNTEKQIGAIWSYLSKGREADVPEGLIRGKMEIIADKEPVIYRNFIAGAGSRAIGVGYPEKANLAFDANELRLALIWQGAFIDGARHRTGRGEGFEPPLGNNVIKMPPGPAFAMLTDANAPWPQATGAKAGYRMRGYHLDEKGRPTFLYSFETIRVEDSFSAVPGELDAGFNRTLTFQCERPRSDLWFRAGVSSRIEATPDGWYVIDDKLKLKFTLAASARPVVRQNGGLSELLVPVIFNGKEARIVEEIIW